MTNSATRLGKAGFTLVALALAASGCSSKSSNDSGSAGHGPVGPVATDAAEAWPEVPTVPALKPEDVVQACAELAVCNPPDGAGANPFVEINLCIANIEWSAERAIPMSNFLVWNERAEYFVACQLAHVGDCAAQKECWSERNPLISCQEDGCSAQTKLSVSCNGSVAHLEGSGKSFDRDCARAYADCDETSPTGCTDRHFSACPAGGNQADRCDGDVRLGCDGAGQVSYHDCTRLGGTCKTASGVGACDYGVADPLCATPNSPAASCSSGMVAACVEGQRYSVKMWSICPVP